MTDFRFLFYTIGIWTTFTLYGISQENLTRATFGVEGQRFSYPLFLIVTQCICNIILATVAILLERRRGNIINFTGGVPSSRWLTISVTYAGSHFFGLQAFSYMIYPLQVLLKSCKAVPVFIGDILIAKASPKFSKLFGVLQLCIGVCCFVLNNKSSIEKGPSSDNAIIGITIVWAALVCDSMYGPLQDKLAKEKVRDGSLPISSWVFMLNLNLYELFICLPVMFYYDHFFPALGFLYRHGFTVIISLITYCTTMALGNVFVFFMQGSYGALEVVKTTTVRKLISVIISVLFYGHSISRIQWFSVFVVFSSRVVESYLSRYDYFIHSLLTNKEKKGIQIEDRKKDEGRIKNKNQIPTLNSVRMGTGGIPKRGNARHQQKSNKVK